MTCPKCGARLYRDDVMTDDGPLAALVCWSGHTVSYRDAHGLIAVPITENLPTPSRAERSDRGRLPKETRGTLLPTIRLQALGVYIPEDLPDDLSEVPE